jgi:rhodanese-related sulfurtransferase
MTENANDPVAEARCRVVEIDAANAIMHHEKQDATFLDVRERNEWNLGHVSGAVHVPRADVEASVSALLNRDRDIVVYCGGGTRAIQAAETLLHLGYEHVSVLTGGFRGWAEGGGEIED